MLDNLGILIGIFQILFYFLLGGAIFFVGILVWKKYMCFFKQAIVVTGKIIDSQSYKTRNRKTGEDVTMYRKIVGFELDGKMHEVTVSAPTSSSKPKVGTLCKIWVNLNDMSEARIYSRTVIAILWLFILSGIFIMAKGFIGLFQI